MIAQILNILYMCRREENNGRLPCKNQPSVTVAQFSCCCGEIEVKKRQIKLAWIHPSLYVYEQLLSCLLLCLVAAVAYSKKREHNKYTTTTTIYIYTFHEDLITISASDALLCVLSCRVFYTWHIQEVFRLWLTIIHTQCIIFSIC